MSRSYMVVLAVMGMLASALAGCGGGGTTQAVSITGTWLAVSATKDGSSDTLADAFGWANGTTSMTLTLNNDGTWVETQLGAGNAIIAQQSGTWSASLNVITWQETQPVAQSEPDMTYSVSGNGSGNTATFTFTPTSGSNAGHKIVGTFTGTV